MGYDRSVSTYDFRFGVNGINGKPEGEFTVKEEDKEYHTAELTECDMILMFHALREVLGDKVNRVIVWDGMEGRHLYRDEYIESRR